MTICSAGHDSADDDFCTVCGLLIAGATSPQSPTTEPATACPACGEPVAGRFCESCGFDVVAGAVSTWTAVVTADRAYFDSITTEDEPITFPTDYRERLVPLTATEVRIGRRSHSSGVVPEIELTDPGVSHLHALLRGQPDGSWTLTDSGSTNGTTVNDDPEPVTTVPLHDGDRIHLGAWTTITLRADERR